MRPREASQHPHGSGPTLKWVGAGATIRPLAIRLQVQPGKVCALCRLPVAGHSSLFPTLDLKPELTKHTEAFCEMRAPPRVTAATPPVSIAMHDLV